MIDKGDIGYHNAATSAAAPSPGDPDTPTAPGGNWALVSETDYIYDGFRVIQERDGSNTPLVSYTRGDDLSGTFEGAGGIGGLLARSTLNTQPSTHAYYHADGNGNITALVDGSQALAASYKYDPFGNTISQSDGLAAANAYRFSSKEQHLNSGMYYYGYRFYDPNLQRWINHDPLEDFGSTAYQTSPLLLDDEVDEGGEMDFFSIWLDANRNLYLQSANNPISLIDPSGLDCLGTAANIAAGVGDNLSFGLTDLARGLLGWNEAVDKDGGAYKWTDRGMTGVQMATGLPGIAKAAEKQAIKQAEKALSRAAAERARNLAKGIAAKDLGPSGKPKIHAVDHATRKAAKDAARNQGKGPPMHHPSDKSQPPHYHPSDECGDKIPGTHHNYPD